IRDLHICRQRDSCPLHLHSFPTRRSSDLPQELPAELRVPALTWVETERVVRGDRQFQMHTDVHNHPRGTERLPVQHAQLVAGVLDRKSTRLNSSHVKISYAVFCLKNIKHT